MTKVLHRLAGLLRGGPGDATPNIMAGPVGCPGGAGAADIAVKVDRAYRIGSSLVVAGWASDELDLVLWSGGESTATTCFRTAREDVARFLGAHDGQRLGFVLLAEAAKPGAVEIECTVASGARGIRFPLRVAQGMPGAEALVQLAPAVERLRANGVALAAGRDDAMTEADGCLAAGSIDDARSGPGSDQTVVSGWLACAPASHAWIEVADGRRFPLAPAHRVDRADVRAALPAALSGYGEGAGFFMRLDSVGLGERLRLVVEREGSAFSLSEATTASWGADPVAAARWLFAYPTPLVELAERVANIDMPVLEAMLAARERSWDDMPVRLERVGAGIETPRASIIVPLYGRFDFVEHQLLEFARDPWLLANAELVYVVDDRDLLARMAGEAWALWRLYGVPFTWVWGGTNRGFAGANNLGATHSHGRQLVFLNSDAIPRGPGWLQPMLDALDSDPGVGAVGVRLLFSDGSMQHAGMEFRRRDDLGIWTNHHPRMGLDASLDPCREPTEVACVTGACMALQREVFDRVGGWDSGYLIGDFEDSDLCLKLQDADLRVLYLPSVELTHLERQSFKLLGEGDFRTRVVVWNAVRHQQRWGERIEALAGAGRGARG